MRMFRRLAAATGLATITLAVAAPAQAHTSLTDATPAKGSTVRPPARIVLTYADPVRFPGVVVIDAHGGHHESGKARVSGNKVTEQVAGVLAPGVYTVGWRVVAEDGHPVTGEYRFTVAGGASPPASAGSAAPSATTPTGPAAGSAQPTRDGSGVGWLWVGAGAVVVAAVAGVVSLLRRRRTTR